VDDIDTLSAREEREAERFATYLRDLRAKPLPLVTRCCDCGTLLDAVRRSYARCVACASKQEARGRR
jgi:hypothetical protein